MNKLIFLLIIVIVGAYYPMFDNFFHSDDFEHIGFILNNFPDIPDFFSSFYHLSIGVHIIDFLTVLFFGINPLPFQIINLAIHIFNVVLVGILITLLTEEKIFGIIGSFYWGLSDKYTEVVLESFQKGRSILFFFLLLTLIFLVVYFKTKKLKYYIFSLITYIFSFFVHFDFVIVCPIILVYVFIYKMDAGHWFSRKNISSIFNIQIIPFLSIFIIYMTLQIFFKSGSLAYARYDFSWNCLKMFSMNILDFLELYRYGYGSIGLGIVFILLTIFGIVFIKDKLIKFGLLFMVFAMAPIFLARFQPSRYLYVPFFGVTLVFIRLLWNFIGYCNKKGLNLLKYGVPISLGIILILTHIYGIRMDEDYRDHRGRIDKDVYSSFKDIFPWIDKNLPVVFVDLKSEYFKAIGFTYYSRYPERYHFKRIVYRYWRIKGVMGLIYLKDLVLLTSFTNGKIFKWQPISAPVQNLKNYNVLIFSDKGFTISKNLPVNSRVKEIGIIRDTFQRDASPKT